MAARTDSSFLLSRRRVDVFAAAHLRLLCVQDSVRGRASAQGRCMLVWGDVDALCSSFVGPLVSCVMIAFRALACSCSAWVLLVIEGLRHSRDSCFSFALVDVISQYEVAWNMQWDLELLKAKRAKREQPQQSDTQQATTYKHHYLQATHPISNYNTYTK